MSGGHDGGQPLLLEADVGERLAQVVEEVVGDQRVSDELGESGRVVEDLQVRRHKLRSGSSTPR